MLTRFNRLLPFALVALAAACAPQAAAQQDGPSLMKRAEAEQAAGHDGEAAKLFAQAAEAFTRAGDPSKAAEAYEKQADALLAAPAQGAAPAQQAAAAPGAPPAATGGPSIPDGLYNCHGIGSNTLFAVIARVEIKGNNYVFHTENDRELLSGTYRLNGAKIDWTSGYLNDRPDGDWEYDSITKSNRMTVYVLPPSAGYAQKAVMCYLSE